MSASGDREALLHQYQNSYNGSHHSGQGSYYDDDDDDDESSASILASVREQEAQFARLTQEIEAERNTVSKQLQQSRNRGASLDSISDTEETFSWRQHPVQSASQITEDIDGQIHSQPKLVDNTLQVFRHDTPTNRQNDRMNDGYYSPNGDSYVTEKTTRQEDYQDPLIQTEVVVGDDGVERTITKKTVTKTVTTHTTRKIEDYESGSLPRSDISRPQDSYRSPHSPDYPDRNHRPTNEESRLLREPSSQSSSNSDLRSGHDAPIGYTRAVGNNYEQRDPRQLTPEKYQPEEYGLEDDRRSDSDDDNDGYGLGPTNNRRDNYEGESSRSTTPRHRHNTEESYDPSADLINDTPVAAPRAVQRAPLAEMETGSRASLDRLDDTTDWRHPSLKEIIRMLRYPMDVVQLNAAGYLQHLCYRDDNIKANVRRLEGIPALVRLLDHANPKVQLNACGALRNLCFGAQNADNKLAIKTCEGVPALVRLVRESKDADVKEQATGTLWNLSAHKELKGQILELAMEPLASFIIIPYSGWQEQQNTKPKKVDLPDILTNAMGVIRNLSSHDSQDYRQRIRDCEDLIDALVYYLRMNVEKEELENKGTENCVCILRNLTYHLYIEAPARDELKLETESRTEESDKSSTSCFGKKKSKADEIETIDQIPPADASARGYKILWQPDLPPLYLAVLKTCVNYPETLEAAAGAIQNMAYGNWQWSVYTRAVVRKDKGLPILVDRLRTDNDRVIRAVSIALTNLSYDSKNKDLIGKYAMRDLAYKLPGSSESQPALSDLTYIAILNTVRVVVERSAQNARHLREAGGLERITTVNNSGSGKYHSRVVKAAGQVLKVLWDLKELHSMYKKDGWNKTHFVPTVTAETLPRHQKAMNNKPYEDAVESGTYPRRNKGNGEDYSMSEKNKKPAVQVEENEGPADSWV